MKRHLIVISIIVLISLLLGAGLQAWLGPGNFAPGGLAAALLVAIGGGALYASWRLAGGGRALAWIVFLAFALRLGFGAAMTSAMPVVGYPQPEQQAGYLSKDAYARDKQAWELGSSTEALTQAFDSKKYSSDQYGGLLALSALVYRVLSPDAHRAYLILILAAFFAALGIPFFWAAVRQRWGSTAALVGAWILALYPESVFWGASQMREPFLISLIAVGLWGAVNLPRRRAPALAALGICLAGLLVFSLNVGLATAGVLAMWIWLEFISGREKPIWRLAGWLSLAAGGVLLIGATLPWLLSASWLDIYSTKMSSGWVEIYVKLVGNQLSALVVTVYGLIRPLLPAAIFETSILSWKLIFTWRALGWYLLLPVLIYGLLAMWHAPDGKDRRQLIWTGLVIVIWTLIASYRGGGDTSDNPRYRVIFLVWMALLAGWAWSWAQTHGFRWLIRWGVVDAIFLLFFTQVYLSRYVHLFPTINLNIIFALIGLLSLGVMAGGWWSDRRKNLKPSSTTGHPV
ncbi:MAG TPA: hypothetical protein VGJ97_10340 [Anaerolineaceae bacterium]|jgi:hypothetical protein